MMKTMLLSLRIILIAALVNQFVIQPINAQSKKLNLDYLTINEN